MKARVCLPATQWGAAGMKRGRAGAGAPGLAAPAEGVGAAKAFAAAGTFGGGGGNSSSPSLTSWPASRSGAAFGATPAPAAPGTPPCASRT